MGKINVRSVYTILKWAYLNKFHSQKTFIKCLKVMVTVNKTLRIPGIWNLSRKILLQPCRRQVNSIVRKEIVTQASNQGSINCLAAATTVLAVAAILCTNEHSTCTGTEQAALPAEFLTELHKLLPSEHIEEHIESLQQRGKPWNSYHRLASHPNIIVSPSSTEEVSQVVKLCHRYHVPLIPFGGGTSIEGHILLSIRLTTHNPPTV